MTSLRHILLATCHTLKNNKLYYSEESSKMSALTLFERQALDR